MTRAKHQNKYKDVTVRIILAAVASHIVVVYGEPESSFQLLLTRDYYTAFAGSFLIACLLIQCVYLVTSFLDRRFEWVEMPLQRVLAQLIFGIGLPGVVACLLATLYFKIRGIDILLTTYEAYDLPFILLMITLLNAYYLAYYFFLRWKAADRIIRTALPEVLAEEMTAQTATTDDALFTVSQGAATVPVPVDNIAYFFRDGDANYLRTMSGEDFFIARSLDDIQLQMDEQRFFRANRQILTSYAAITQYGRLDFGKFRITLHPPFTAEVVVSQKKAKAFRRWRDSAHWPKPSAGPG